MSTTVKYKGNTLTTVSNDTKTLKTAGKYMEGDVVLTDVSGGTGAISVVDTLDTNGGTIRTITAVDISDTTAVASDVAQGKYFYTADGTKTEGTSTGGGGDNWTWMGKNPTKVATFSNGKVFLKDSPYATWTPTTTKTTLVSASNFPTQEINLSDHDYIIYYRWHTHFNYSGGTTPNYAIDDYYFNGAHVLFSYRNSVHAFTDNTDFTSRASILGDTQGIFYKTGQGINNYYGTSSGVFPSITIPSCSITSVTAKNFVINAQCNSSYFSTYSASNVDQDTSYYEWTIELWQIDFHTSTYGHYHEAIYDMWKNGF